MKTHKVGLATLFWALLCLNAGSQTVTNWLPGRVINKIVPDYLRPRMYALNQASGSVPGTVLALDATTGTTLGEISVNLNPTDMAMSPAGDALYVINAGSRTITKIDLSTFTVASEKTISTPNTYSTSNPIYVAAGKSNLVYFTDGGWAPNITTFDYQNGTNVAVYDDGNGAGGITLTRSGQTLYRWRQYGWGAGNVNSWVTRYTVATNGSITAAEDSFTSWRRDPTDTRIFLDGGERWVFNKQQMFAATNVSVLLNSFADNIYAISLDGTIALGPTQVFNTQNGAMLTNFPISTTVQALSGDQKKLFRYRSSTSDMFVHDMASVAPVSGPSLAPTPANGAVIGLAPTNLLWTASPIALAYDIYLGTNQTQVTNANVSSAQYVGRVNSPGIPPNQALNPGTTYYWRVDVVGFSVTNAGPVWSFTVSPISITPPQINLGAVAGFSPGSVSLSLTSSVAKPWSASVGGASWAGINVSTGTTPSNITVSFNTAALAVGLYTNQINVNVGSGLVVQVPITLDIKALNITKMATDYQRPYIYALQAPAASGQNGQLLFINTGTGNIDKSLPIGINPTDLAVHYGEGRLYIASWTENNTYVVDLTTQTLLPPLQLGTDVYKINAGKPGQIIIEGEDQWVYMSLINTTNGATITTGFVREGDGECDPTGRYYYHSDNNISGAGISKFDISTNTFTSVAGAGGHYYYGSRNVVMAADGTRLFWTAAAYDANLNDLGYLGEEIYATTAHGDLAFASPHVFNVNNGQSIYTLPFSTSVMAVSGDQQKLFLFNTTSQQLTNIPMSSIATVPGPGLNPTPANGSTINLPLAQVSWTTSPFALRYRVWMGTNQAAVTSATTNSPLFLGETTATSLSLSNALTPGIAYYWRVDSVGFSSVTAGTVWSFTGSQVSVFPQSLSLKGVVGVPMSPQSLSVTALLATAWSATVSQPWMTLSAANGTTPSTLTLNFNTAGLAAGFYTNYISLTSSTTTQQFPVVLQLFNLAASKMAVDPNRNFIYVLHPGSGGINDAFVLFLNTDTGSVETVLPIGSNATDLTVNPREDRLYVSNWQRTQTHVVNLPTRTELAPLSLGTDVYKINAGLQGRVIIEGEDQWVGMSLIETTNGTTVASGTVREGDGESDPTGRYYYHVDNNSSGAVITKFDVGNNSFVSLASAGPHYYYGSRNLVMSLDGTRLFWTSAMYDANVVDLGVIGVEIYACSTNGSIAFGANQAYDTSTKQLIYTLPVSSTAMAVDRKDQRLWFFDSNTAQIGSIAMATIRAPSITAQPAASTSVPANGNVYLTVTAAGLAPLSYQWTFGAANIPNATNYFLSMNPIQPGQDGDYRVIVSNPYAAVTSSIAHVTVLVAPTISAQPQGTNVLAGRSFSLSVTAGGSAPLAYAWMFESGAIGGATTSTLTINNAQAANEGVYRVQISNAAGSITSAPVSVRVLPSAPLITAQPVSLSVGASSNALFSVSSIGSQPLTYQWWFGNIPVPGATGSQLNLANVQSANSGSYSVVVANGNGASTSSVATLTVTPVLPYFVTQPIGASIPASSNVNMAVLARGSEPVAYQWRRYGTNLPGATLTSFAISNAALADSGLYSVLASNVAGLSTSLVAIVTVTASPPVFVQQPVSLAVLAGTNATFSSLAIGSNPLRYQWYFQSNALPGATNNQLVINPATGSSAGQYYLVASNVFATSTSAVVSLTVTTAPPVFSLQPISGSALAGGVTTLSARATGASPLVYRWFFQSNAIPNQTNSSLAINPVQVSSAGYYYVTASNSFGSATSAIAQLTVNVPPGLTQGLSNVVADVGNDVTLSISATGTGPLSYSWQLNGVTLAETNSGLSLTNIQVSRAGFYRATVSSPYGVLSSTGRVSVLRAPGSLAAWGDNSGNQTNVPAGLIDVVAFAGGDYHSVALRHAGTIVGWGYNGDGQTSAPVNSLRFVSVAAGAAHNLAVTEAGSIIAWGRNDAGQCNVPAAASNSVLQVAAGDSHSLALLSAGTVLAWGDNTSGQASVPQGLNGVIAIAAGRNHSLALRTNGVIAWGYNAYGQATVPAISNVVAISAGYLHSVALLSNGTVAVWGDNTYGQTNVPSFATNVTAIAAGDFHTLALRNDGSVIGWGNNSFQQIAPPAGLNATAIASGNYHGLALTPQPQSPQIFLVSSKIVVRWPGMGTLQWAPSPRGPFSDVICFGNCYTNLTSAPAGFFRIRR